MLKRNLSQKYIRITYKCQPSNLKIFLFVNVTTQPVSLKIGIYGVVVATFQKTDRYGVPTHDESDEFSSVHPIYVHH